MILLLIKECFKIFEVAKSKREGWIQYVIPMKDECHSDMFSDVDSLTWAYYLDGRRHGKIPTLVLPGLMDIFGGEDCIRSAGYRKHWCVFLDKQANEFTFENRASFAKSYFPEERELAQKMFVVDINLLQQL